MISREETIAWLRKMADYEEQELMTRCTMINDENIPDEDKEKIRKILKDSVGHANLLNELIYEVAVGEKNEY